MTLDRDPELDEELPPGCSACGKGWDVCVCPPGIVERVAAYLHEYVDYSHRDGTRGKPCDSCRADASKIVEMCKTYLEEQ